MNFPGGKLVNAQRTLRSAIHFVSLMAGILLIFFFVQTFGVNVPVNDDWDHLNTSLAWKAGGIDFHTLLVLHNEHCLAVPRIWNHLLLVSTGGDFKAVLLANAALAALLLGLVLKFVRDWKLPLPVFLLLILSLALGISSWCQWQNFLWAFQAPYFTLPLFLVAAAIVLARCRSDRLAIPFAMGVVWLAVFTNSNGIFVGWALLPSVFAGSRGRAWLTAYALNLAIATGVAAWLISASTGPALGGLGGILERPLDVFFAGLAVLGSPFVPALAFLGKNGPLAIAGIFVLAGACLLAVGFRSIPTGHRIAEAGPGLALALYGFLSVAAVVYGRSDLLLTAPIESRYQSFALIGILGLILTAGAFSTMTLGRARWVATAVASLAALGLSAGTMLSMPLLLAHGKNMQTALASHQEILRNAENPEWEPKLAEILGPRASDREAGIERLKSDLARLRDAGLLHPDWQARSPTP
jgi:hypothetical protein